MSYDNIMSTLRLVIVTCVLGGLFALDYIGPWLFIASEGFGLFIFLPVSIILDAKYSKIR